MGAVVVSRLKEEQQSTFKDAFFYGGGRVGKSLYADAAEVARISRKDWTTLMDYNMGSVRMAANCRCVVVDEGFYTKDPLATGDGHELSVL